MEELGISGLINGAPDGAWGILGLSARNVDNLCADDFPLESGEYKIIKQIDRHYRS